MRECEECRTLMEHLHPEVSHLAPAMAELLRVDAAAPAGMRERFLQRAAEEGLVLSAGMEVEQRTVAPIEVRGGLWTRFGGWLDEVFAPRRFVGYAAAGTCLLVAGVVLGRELGPKHGASGRDGGSAAVAVKPASQAMEVVQPVQAATVASAETSAGSGEEAKELRAELAALTQRLEVAAAKAEALEATKSELERSLAAASDQAALSAEERDAEKRASLAASAQMAGLRQQLEDAKSKLLTLDAVAAIQEKQTTEAQARVASLKAEMDQLYAARSSAESMISARNLHIIDVYDDNGRGSGQGAFGRVFYVQGKSLVFYAYDLPNPKKDKNFSFQLWGEGQGLEPTTYKLGLLKPDSTGHGRWVVACDDPKILGQLRGVFIAPPSTKGDVPSASKKMMYAMLGSANHP